MQEAPYRYRGRQAADVIGGSLEPGGFAAFFAKERGFVVIGDTALIPLQRKGIVGNYALVSREDRHLGRYYWSQTNWNYVRRRDKHGRTVMMHREVMGLKTGDEGVVDHVNRDQLDNRRENLRIVTQAQNTQNQGARRKSTSKYRGVSLRSVDGMWVVNHKLGSEQFYSGAYVCEEEANRVAIAWRQENMPHSTD